MTTIMIDPNILSPNTILAIIEDLKNSGNGAGTVKALTRQLQELVGEKEAKSMLDRAGRKDETERRQMRETKAYGLFMAGQQEKITRKDFEQFLRVNEYFGKKARARRVEVVERALAKDSSLLGEVWGYLKERFMGE